MHLLLWVALLAPLTACLAPTGMGLRTAGRLPSVGHPELAALAGGAFVEGEPHVGAGLEARLALTDFTGVSVGAAGVLRSGEPEVWGLEARILHQPLRAPGSPFDLLLLVGGGYSDEHIEVLGGWGNGDFGFHTGGVLGLPLDPRFSLYAGGVAELVLDGIGTEGVNASLFLTPSVGIALHPWGKEGPVELLCEVPLFMFWQVDDYAWAADSLVAVPSTLLMLRLRLQ